MKSNERAYYISTINIDVAKQKMQAIIDSRGILTAKDVKRIVSSTAGVYDPKVEDLTSYGWHSLKGSFSKRAGSQYFLQLPVIEKLERKD